jgi:hypothetical protein
MTKQTHKNILAPIFPGFSIPKSYVILLGWAKRMDKWQMLPAGRKKQKRS